MASRVVAIFASSAGLRKLVASTIVPELDALGGRRDRARAASTPRGSRWPGPSSRKMRWS